EHRSALEAGVTRADLASINGLDGGARNALDCALWDLEAKIEGKSIAELVCAPPLKPVPALVTVTLDTPEAMGAKAASYSSFPVLKLKLDGDQIVERVRAVRTARPDADIVIDANCAWDIDTLKSVADDLSGLGVKMVEQPLPASSDRDIDATFPFPLCADESCQTEDDLPSLVGKFQMINIKLDKCGGLTAALALADKAQAMGFDLMVGNMLGTSLAMAPSHVIAQRCAFADLDGPVSLVEDYPHGMAYDDAVIAPPTKDLWG
ncbi:MAG: dipeptide epimerase, partial [Pseudomonadota bacterium]